MAVSSASARRGRVCHHVVYSFKFFFFPFIQKPEHHLTRPLQRPSRVHQTVTARVVLHARRSPPRSPPPCPISAPLIRSSSAPSSPQALKPTSQRTLRTALRRASSTQAARHLKNIAKQAGQLAAAAQATARRADTAVRASMVTVSTVAPGTTEVDRTKAAMPAVTTVQRKSPPTTRLRTRTSDPHAFPANMRCVKSEASAVMDWPASLHAKASRTVSASI